ESAWHEVEVLPESRLAAILGDGRVRVNSRHHQGVTPDIVGSGLRVTSIAPDGWVEGLEGASQRWLVSVQWHPERPEMAGTMGPLFREFVRAAGG
ncbi:MAG: gamma-glutamyl-gamma-aminobutyrate hydrolase family protein, partial [Chloroflexota bacterium]|nr:gamma-glutamyl-gamma-aminobutyrate hydrolase family protein [Chloroflexota bacterium]